MNGQMTVEIANCGRLSANRELADVLRPDQNCFNGRRKVKKHFLTGLPFLFAGLLTLITSLVLPLGVGFGVVAAGYLIAGAVSSAAIRKSLSERSIALHARLEPYGFLHEHIPCMAKRRSLGQPNCRSASVPLRASAAAVPPPVNTDLPSTLKHGSAPKLQLSPETTSVINPLQRPFLPRCRTAVEQPLTVSTMPPQRLPANNRTGTEVNCQVKLPSVGDSANSSAVLVANSDCLVPMTLCTAKPVSTVTHSFPAQPQVVKALKLIKPVPESVKTKTGHPGVTMPLVRYQRQALPVTATDPLPASVNPMSMVPHRVIAPVTDPTTTTLAVPASNVAVRGAGTQRSLMITVALERVGDDFHLLLGHHTLQAPSSLVLKVDELTTPHATDSHSLRLSLLGEGVEVADSFTVTVSSGQLATLADQLNAGTGRLVIDGKSLPALAGTRLLPLCASQQSVANIDAVANTPLQVSEINAPDGLKSGVSVLSPGNVGPEQLSTSPKVPTAVLRDLPSLRPKGIWRIKIEGHHSRNLPKLPPLLVPGGSSSAESTSPDSPTTSSPTSSTSPSSVVSEPGFTASDSDSGNSPELIPSAVAMPASASSRKDFPSLPLPQIVADPVKCSPKQSSYMGLKRFASDSDICHITRNMLVDQSDLTVLWRARADVPVCSGSLSSAHSPGTELPEEKTEDSWEVLESFGQLLKKENQDLELHEHLVHQQAYNLEGKQRVKLLGGQQCLVEKVLNVPDGLNAYTLLPETIPAEGAIEVRLIFRGTKDRASVIRDLESSGAGFETMETAAVAIMRHLQIVLTSLNIEGQKINLTIGGHSLGGADAQNFLGHLLGAVTAGSAPCFSAIGNITLFTKCSAGVPKLAHERVCSALEQLKGKGVRLKIFHLKVDRDVVQATGDCHLGAGLPYETADVSVLQVYPPVKSSVLDRHTKKYFADDTNLSPVHWYKRTQNNTEAGMAEINRSLHNTSAFLRYGVVKTVQRAIHCAAWYIVPTGSSRAKPQLRAVPAESAISSVEACSTEEIQVAYDKIISKCLGLSKRHPDTPWEKINPYDSPAADSVLRLKKHYLEKMLQEDAFGAGAEFQNFVNQVNTHVQNILDPKMMMGLQVMIGLGGELSRDPNLQFKGLEVRDALWPVTVGYCEKFFKTAAEQYKAATPSRSQHKDRPAYTFDLLLQLQAFNIRYTELERGVDKINYLKGKCPTLRAAKLALLKREADSLLYKADNFYRQCKTNRLINRQIEFILGPSVSLVNGCNLTSQKVVNIKNAIEKQLK